MIRKQREFEFETERELRAFVKGFEFGRDANDANIEVQGQRKDKDTGKLVLTVATID
jgi:hypothetical protein